MKGLWELQCDACNYRIPYGGETCIYCGADKAEARAKHDVQLAAERGGLGGASGVAVAAGTGFATFLGCEMAGLCIGCPSIGTLLGLVGSVAAFWWVVELTNPGLTQDVRAIATRQR